jgi:outer membrane protein OmpA-like peptidoglycan-associated protein
MTKITHLRSSHTPDARRRAGRQWGLPALVVSLILAACAAPGGPQPAAPEPAPASAPAAQAAPAPAPAPPPAAPTPPPTLPFEQAVLSAANTLLSKAQLPVDGRFDLVVDPLIDGVTGQQTQATRTMGTMLVKLIEERYPRFQVKPFNAANVASGPLILIGTFSGVNAQRKTEGKRETYWICLALADLRTGKIISKGVAFALPDGVNSTPLPFYQDAPALVSDDATSGYVRTCQGTKPGDSINPMYLDRIVTAATIADAIDSYNDKRYADALKLYETALDSPGGNQLRVHTGLYLTNLRLGKRPAAAKAFGSIVDQGLSSQRMGVKFLFKPGTAAMWTQPGSGPVPYTLWLTEIAARAAKRDVCMDVVGHTSATGAEPINERLSLQRAETVKREIAQRAPKLKKNLSSAGAGSREMLVGSGRDDLSDALDRRVEFKVKGC